MALERKMLLIGKGHLGQWLRQRWRLPEEQHWVREMADLTPAVLAGLRPAVVVNCAGKTDLPWCEANPLEAFRCNVAAPLSVFRAVREAFGKDVPYIHLSSGCVWDGPYRPDGRAFRPDDPPTPACFYSWTKAACDALLLAEAAAPVLILRPRQVYSPVNSPRNTLSKLKLYPKLLDTPNSMTSAETIARTMEAVLASRDPACWNRIMNVYDRGDTSPFEVGTFLAQAGLRAPPERLSKEALDAFHKPKRVDAVLEDPFFEKLVGPPSVQSELQRNIAAFKQALAVG